ncbi:RNA polymerase sigma-70 factor [soil metagenome]
MTPAQRRDTDAFLDHRERLVRVAYRMLGSVSDAEDVVQDAWLRWQRADRSEVADPLAFLVRTTSRLALDRLRQLTARREEYHGEWLPEPFATNAPETEAIARDDLSMAMMRVLELLSPLERVVFVLREAFDYSHAEIGVIVGRTEPTVRQLAHRARLHVDESRPRYRTDPRTQRDLTERFLVATQTGDLEALLKLLAPDVTLVADGGGKVRAPLLPVVGADAVGRFLLAVGAREAGRIAASAAVVNDGPAIVVSSAAGVQAVIALDVTEGRIGRIYLVGNPDKLRAMSRLG